ncbi:MAG: DUF4956 domain-containing protein [Planctomycetota bacterium]
MERFINELLTYREAGSTLGVETILLCLLLAFVLGQLVAWLYVWTHRGISYSSSMPQSLIVLALVITLVMLVVGNNLARAFGLFGALALIRFRTPVKDSWDTVFLFFAVSVGIAVGTQNLMIAVVGTVVLWLVIAYLSVTRFGSGITHNGLLRLRLPAGGEAEAEMRSVLSRYCDSVSLVHMREAGPAPIMEFAFQIKLIDSSFGSRMISEVLTIEGVSAPSLLMQDEEAQP